MNQLDGGGGGHRAANRAAKFLSRFASQHIHSPTNSSPRRASHYDRNTGYSPAPEKGSIDRSADYWAMHLELQAAVEKNEILQSTTEQELYHARVRVDEANEARRVVEMEATLQIQQGKEAAQKLHENLDKERVKVQQLLQQAKELDESMRKKKQELMAEVDFQEKRAEDIRQSGVRLQLLAENTLKDAGEQTAEANRQVGEMRKSLQLAKSYQLHTTLEQITSQFTARENKLKRMIAHLQADKSNLLVQVVEIENERNIFKEHLRAVLSEPVIVPVSKTGGGEKSGSGVASVPPAPAASVAASLFPVDNNNNTGGTAGRTMQHMIAIRSSTTGEIFAVKIQ